MTSRYVYRPCNVGQVEERCETRLQHASTTHSSQQLYCYNIDYYNYISDSTTTRHANADDDNDSSRTNYRWVYLLTTAL